MNKKAVSLKQVTGKNYKPLELAKELCSYVENEWEKLLVNQTEVINRYTGFLYKKNEKVKLKKDNRIFEGIVKTVLLTGELVIQTSVEEQFKVGEIEWLQ